MPIPEKLWCRKDEAADKLGLDPSDIEDYLLSGQLGACVKLPITGFYKCTLDEKDNIVRHGVEYYKGLFEIIVYDNLEWKWDHGCIGACCLRPGRDILKHAGTDGFLMLLEVLWITEDDIVISSKEINRFLNAPVQQLPYLDREHPYFALELEAAVSAWMALYGSGSFKSKKSHKKELEEWIRNNYKGRFSQNALDRIVTLANPNKEGGSPKTD
jgi:hypothetical protein